MRLRIRKDSIQHLRDEIRNLYKLLAIASMESERTAWKQMIKRYRKNLERVIERRKHGANKAIKD